MHLTIIGGGNMGTALAIAIIKSKSHIFNQLTICARNETKCRKLRNKFRSVLAEVNKSNQLNYKIEPISAKVLTSSQVIILAVKPLDMSKLLAEIAPFISQQLIISIAAGVTISKIQSCLKTAKIVRVMPNTPSLIGQGICGWLGYKKITREEKKLTKTILRALGEELEMKNEEQIEAVTALSGCGPAYVFYFLQSLIKGGIKLGLPLKIAKKLAIATVIGAANLAKVSENSLEILINQVASKGGATEQALKVLTEKNLKEIIKEAMRKAYKRAGELNV